MRTVNASKCATSQRLGQAFIIASQAKKTGHPGEAALHYPSKWQKHEAALGHWQFDYLQAHSMLLGCLSGVLTGIPLIHKSQFYMLVGHILNASSQFANLSTILLVGRRHMQCQQMTQRIDRQVNFPALASFGPIIASPIFADHGLDCSVRLSKMAAEGSC